MYVFKSIIKSIFLYPFVLIAAVLIAACVIIAGPFYYLYKKFKRESDVLIIPEDKFDWNTIQE